MATAPIPTESPPRLSPSSPGPSRDNPPSALEVIAPTSSRANPGPGERGSGHDGARATTTGVSSGVWVGGCQSRVLDGGVYGPGTWGWDSGDILPPFQRLLLRAKCHRAFLENLILAGVAGESAGVSPRARRILVVI